MLRRMIICALALAGAVAAVVPLASGAAAPTASLTETPPGASVRLMSCSVATHEAVFRGQMQRATGARQMGMRFTLLERTDPAGFRPVSAPGLRRWHRSQPGVGAFAYRQRVRNLAPNTVYRVRVDFRWYAADGSVVQRLRRFSAVCRQFVSLPNLEARVTGASDTQVPGVLRYGVRVTNTGRAAASAVPVRLTVDDGVLDTVTIATLPPGEHKQVGFRGPACTRTVRAEVDPDRTIAETSETDNVSERACADLPRR